MMKLYLKFILFLLIVAVAGLFFLKGSDGRPLLTIDKIKMHGISLPSIDPLKHMADKTKNFLNPSKASKDRASDKSAQTVTVYRWKDKNGTWNYSNIANGHSEAVQIRPYENVVPDPKPAERGKQQKNMDKECTMGSAASLPSPLSVPVSEIPKLIRDAKGLQQKMNTHADAQNVPEVKVQSTQECP
jgi:hypothetical protein